MSGELQSWRRNHVFVSVKSPPDPFLLCQVQLPSKFVFALRCILPNPGQTASVLEVEFLAASFPGESILRHYKTGELTPGQMKLVTDGLNVVSGAGAQGPITRSIGNLADEVTALLEKLYESALS